MASLVYNEKVARKVGIEIGREEGLERGIEKGKKEGQDYVLELMKQGLSYDEIKKKLEKSAPKKKLK